MNISYKVEIVIAGRNHSKYLDETISSAIAQGVPVTYVDDCSNDNSIEIASRYPITILRNDSIKGVAASRNKGIKATKAPYLIFLDSDDILTDNFVKLHLEASNNNVVTYGPAQAFGELDCLWGVPQWKDYDKWVQNTVNTSAMWSRLALLAAGGWNESLESMWDYDLMLKCSKLGTLTPSKAILNYRIHSDSFSGLTGERVDSLPLREKIRQNNVTITIASLISNRLNDDFRIKWLDNLGQMAKYSNYPINLHLIFNGPSYFVHNYDNIFSTIKTSSIPTIIEKIPNNIELSKLLCSFSNKIQSESTDDLILFVEDDILPEIPALKKAVKYAISGEVPPIIVAAPYINRHNNEILGGETIINNQTHYLKSLPNIPIKVKLVGTGFMLFWRDRPGTPKSWEPTLPLNNGLSSNAHDWNFCSRVKGDILLCPDIKVGHAQSEENILWTKQK